MPRRILVITTPFSPRSRLPRTVPRPLRIVMICTVMIGGITGRLRRPQFIACPLTGATMTEFVRDSIPFLVALVAIVCSWPSSPDRALLANRTDMEAIDPEFPPPPRR